MASRKGFKQMYNMDNENSAKSNQYKQMFDDNQPDIVNPSDTKTWGSNGFNQTYGYNV